MCVRVSEQVREVSGVKRTQLQDTLHRAQLKALVEANKVCQLVYIPPCSPALGTGYMAKALHTFALLGNR